MNTSNDENKSNTPGKRPRTSKQIVALIGVVLLVALYVVTLIVAIVDRSSSGRWFGMCLFATVFVPLLIWIYTWMYGKLTNKHTIADFDLGTKSDDTTTPHTGK